MNRYIPRVRWEFSRGAAAYRCGNSPQSAFVTIFAEDDRKGSHRDVLGVSVNHWARCSGCSIDSLQLRMPTRRVIGSLGLDYMYKLSLELHHHSFLRFHHTARHNDQSAKKKSKKSNKSKMSAVASNTWSTILETPEFTEHLLSLVHSRDELEKAGYLMEPLTSEQMQYMKRCANCRRKLYKGAQRPRRDSLKMSTLTFGQEKSVLGIGLDKLALSEDYDVRSLLKEVEPAQDIPKPRQDKKEQEPVCRYHPSEAVYKSIVVKNLRRCCLVYPCCGSRDLYSKGCVSSAKHTPLEYPPDVFEKAWEFFPTPAASNRRTAVALDCEMGVNTMGESELIRISMVDFFTGQTLIDSLVRPKDVKIKDYNTRYSGVSKQDMNDAIAKGRFLDGKAAAREEVWKFVNPDTIVIGHGACADLKDLRWIHGNIVDSVNVVGPGIRKRSLKSLTMDLLGKSVQNKKGHDSLEDALASRELVIWWVGQMSTPRNGINLLLD